MNSNLEISIPSDSDGFILLQCPLCGEYFKLSLDDIHADDVFQIWCPNCGLISDNYLPEEVKDLALRKIKNEVNSMIHDSLKGIERKNRGYFVSFKANKTPQKEYEFPIIPGVDTMEIQHYTCCNRKAKITTSLKLIGSFCPFCGVRCDE